MQLPASEITAEAFNDLWENRRDFTAFAALPVLLVSIVGTATVALFAGGLEGFETLADIPPDVMMQLFVGSVINLIVSIAAYTAFAVAWHRRLLVGPEPTVGAAMRWGRRQWLYFRRLLLLLINLFALTVVLGILLSTFLPAPLVLSALLIGVALIYARAAMVFPAAATDRAMRYGESISLTKGNGWRLFLPVVLVPVAVTFFGSIVVFEVSRLFGELVAASITARFLVTLAIQAINYIGFAVGISALSIAYQRLTA